MKIGVIILCRYNSKRLPGKILIEIDKKPVLQHIVDAVKSITPHYVVATSTEVTDTPIIEYCQANGIPYFQGSLNNVAKRFMDAALQEGFDYAIRINGDNLFVNTEVLKKMVLLENYEIYDFLTNVPGRSFPFGMSVEMVNIAFYKIHFPSFSERHQEHVTLYFYDNEAVGKRLEVTNKTVPQAKGLNLAIDTNKDLEKAKFIFSKKKNDSTYFTLKELVELALKYGQ